MKKALLAVAAVALVIWVATWFRAPEAVATSAAQTWPAGLGTLDSVAARLTPLAANDASAKLTALANALPKSQAVEDYVGREIARGELAIGEPPSLPDVSAIRELLLRGALVWERPNGVGDIGDQKTSARRVAQMTAARALVASALAKARAHDAAAWEDLHAVWNLARSIDPQPQMMEQTAAFSMIRMVNAVAWKLPLPAPAWFAELQALDPMRRLLEAFQYQAASYWEDGAKMFPTKSLAGSVEHDRAIAEAVFRETRCDVMVPMNDLGVDLSSVWRRAFRYRAEREATANALRVREGKPIETRSRCSDGSWTFDGTTLRFSRAIPTHRPDTPMPLVLRAAEPPELRADCVALQPMAVGPNCRSVTPPVLVHRVEPKAGGAKGVVILQAIIDANGMVCDARVIRGVGEAADAAALEAVRQWRFRPALCDGSPRAAYFSVSVSFR